MKCQTCGQINYASEGGKARSLKLSPQRRKEIAVLASRSRGKKVTVQELEQSMEQRLPDTKIGKCISCQKRDVVLKPVVIHGMKAFLCGECAASV